MHDDHRPRNKNARDADIFPLAEPLLFEDYPFLVPATRSSEKKRLFSGDAIDPTLSYNHLPSEERVAEWKQQLEKLTSKVESHSDRVVRRAYQSKIVEIHHKIDLLSASMRGDDRAFHTASRALYGTPRADIVSYTLSILREKVLALQQGQRSFPYALKKDIERIAEYVAHVPLRLTARDLISPHILPVPVSDKTELMKAEEVRHLCLEALARHGITDWRVQIVPSGVSTTFDTNHEKKIVYVPRDDMLRARKNPMTRLRAMAVIAHEIETHVVRRHLGEYSPLLLLSRGLAHYIRGEEGLATYMEQQILGSTDFSGEGHYLALLFAGDALDNTERAIGETYAMTHAYLMVSAAHAALVRGSSLDYERTAILNAPRAWSLVLRIFRGTSGSTPGAVFNKDVVYRDGNVAIWELVSREPDVRSDLFLGKYDPCNTEHRFIMKELKLVKTI